MEEPLVVGKCCSLGEAYSSDGSCISEEFDPIIQLPSLGLVRLEPSLAPACERMDEINWNLVPGGDLVADGSRYSIDEYCLERYNNVLTAFICSTPEEEELQYRLYPCGMFISLPFFAATLAVYALLPELHRVVNGKCIMSYLVAMIIAYSSLAVLQLATDFLPIGGCIGLGYVMQFAFLATFFWLNIMCFDIWWTFSSLKKAGVGDKERDRRKFFFYSVYAWGVPLIILAITLFVDFGNVLSPTNRFKPGMGENKCFFDTPESTWLYLYGPVALIIVCNLLMFGVTAQKIFLHSKETKVLRSGDSQRHDSKDRERFNLYLKLFIVMGVNWVAELISWTVNSPASVWYLTDITNTLQGVIIFIIFVCKKRVLHLVEARLCPGRARARQLASSLARSRLTATSSAPSTTVTEQVKLNENPDNSDTKV